MSELKDLLEQMPSRFDAAAWGSSDATIGFNITGEGGGQWVARIQGGKLTVTEEPIQDATMTMTCDAADMLAMIKGELNGVSAFMQGKLKIEGDMSLAMKLQSLIG